MTDAPPLLETRDLRDAAQLRGLGIDAKRALPWLLLDGRAAPRQLTLAGLAEDESPDG